MKKFGSIGVCILLAASCYGQNIYPEPEFMNEVYSYRKDSAAKLLRLEKTTSKLDSKTKAGGFGGAESSYIIEGASSPVQLSAQQTSFIISNGGTKPAFNMDSLMRANGMDPAKTPPLPGMGGGDPTSTLSFYKVSAESANRKIIYMKTPGAFGGKKMRSSEKPGFSVRKIREGYWELVLDKPLQKGEYAFTTAAIGSMEGGVSVFAFRVE